MYHLFYYNNAEHMIHVHQTAHAICILHVIIYQVRRKTTIIFYRARHRDAEYNINMRKMRWFASGQTLTSLTQNALN